MENKIERFTPNSRLILSLAEEEAKRLQHTTIGTQHILLGIIRSEYGVAGHVLRDLGLELSHVRDAVRFSSQEKSQQNFFQQILNRFNQKAPTEIDLSPQVKKLLELAVNKARRMGDHHIRTEHLLLGLVQHEECKALDILKRFGISTRVIRSQTIKLLKEIPDQTTRTDQPPPFYNKMERFTEKSHHVLQLAQEEAQRLQHSSIDTQHILIGLIYEDDGVASRVLRDLKVDLDHIIEIGEQLSPEYGDKPLEIAPDTKKILELAIDESRRMEHIFIGTEHLLLGLVRHEESIAFNILRQLDISPEDIRRRIKTYI